MVKRFAPFFIIVGVSAIFLGIMLSIDNGLFSRKSSTASGFGGPFELVDHNGRVFTQDNLKGKYSFIYFGYSYCPDICPTSLADMVRAIKGSHLSTMEVQPIFITVDPHRDTVSHIANYVDLFDEQMLGLTGSEQQIEHVKSLFHVYSKNGVPDEADDYLVDHSSLFYLMDKNGLFLKFFPSTAPVEAMIDYLNANLE